MALRPESAEILVGVIVVVNTGTGMYQTRVVLGLMLIATAAAHQAHIAAEDANLYTVIVTTHHQHRSQHPFPLNYLNLQRRQVVARPLARMGPAREREDIRVSELRMVPAARSTTIVGKRKHTVELVVNQSSGSVMARRYPLHPTVHPCPALQLQDPVVRPRHPHPASLYRRL